VLAHPEDEEDHFLRGYVQEVLRWAKV